MSCVSTNSIALYHSNFTNHQVHHPLLSLLRYLLSSELLSSDFDPCVVVEILLTFSAERVLSHDFFIMASRRMNVLVYSGISRLHPLLTRCNCLKLI